MGSKLAGFQGGGRAEPDLMHEEAEVEWNGTSFPSFFQRRLKANVGNCYCRLLLFRKLWA